MTKILIVDDALFMRCRLRQILEKGEYNNIAEAENGYSAIEKFRELRPDITTMDITMPDINGIKVIRLIREIDSEARIIVISALGYAPMIKKAIIAGASDFLIKPFKEENVIKVINRLSKK